MDDINVYGIISMEMVINDQRTVYGVPFFFFFLKKKKIISIVALCDFVDKNSIK